MDKEKIVIDTNLLISALGWDGKPRALFMQILDGKHELRNIELAIPS
jgi:predicted nucleic acid-binding protein